MSLPDLQPYYTMQWCLEDGQLTAEAALFNDNVSQTMVRAIDLLNDIAQTNLVTNGITFDGLIAPSKTTAEIAALEPNSALGTIWFDTNDAKLKVKTASGVVQTITST